mgnify:CR=1 FL=1
MSVVGQRPARAKGQSDGAIARTGIVETQLVGGVEADAVGLTGEADIPALLLDLLPALCVVQVVQVFSLLRQAPRKVGLKL